MSATLRNIIALIVGIVVGAIINSGIINISNSVVPLPPGMDPNDVNSLRENIHLFQPINYLMPWLAHAIGTLIGAYVTARIATNYQFIWAMVVGVIFMVGGISMVVMLPEAALWFDVLDLGLAYLPMAFLGWKLSGGKNTKKRLTNHLR